MFNNKKYLVSCTFQFQYLTIINFLKYFEITYLNMNSKFFLQETAD